MPALPSNSIVDRAALRLPAGELTLVELTVRGERHGVLVTVAERVTGSVKGSLAALATAVSLALESAALTEEVHRRAGEARFASLVQHASDLITVLDADGTVIYQSPSVERVLGYSAEDIVGTPFDTLLDRSHEARLPHLLTDRATLDPTRCAGLRLRAAASRWRHAALRDALHEPARRRERPGHRAQRP